MYNMRHVQEHAAQLNMFLGQNAMNVASDWVTLGESLFIGFSSRLMTVTSL